MHRASTIAAIMMTPLLTKVLAGQLVPVDAVVRHSAPLVKHKMATCVALERHAGRAIESARSLTYHCCYQDSFWRMILARAADGQNLVRRF
jgi:hypothetical protein